MKHAIKGSAELLHRIKTIEKEVINLKLSLLKQLSPDGKNVVTLKGILKGIDITDQR